MANESILNIEAVGKASDELLKYIKNSVKKDEETNDKKNLLEDAEDIQESTDIFLQIITKKFISGKKNFKPKKIPVPNPIFDETAKICLFTNDPESAYESVLLSSENETEGKDLKNLKRINKIIGNLKLKGEFKSYESRRKLYSEYDLFLSSESIVPRLPKLLGKSFYSKSKLPLTIRTESGSVKAKNNKNKNSLKTKKSKKVEEDEDEEDEDLAKKYNISVTAVNNEIGKILNSVHVILPNNVTTSVKIGSGKFSSKQLTENIDSVVNHFINKLIPSKVDGLRAVYIKTSKSPAIPIFYNKELFETEDDIISDVELSNDGETNPIKNKKRKRNTNVEDLEADIDVPEGANLSNFEKALTEIVDEDSLPKSIKKKISKGLKKQKLAASEKAKELELEAEKQKKEEELKEKTKVKSSKKAKEPKQKSSKKVTKVEKSKKTTNETDKKKKSKHSKKSAK